MNTIRSLASTRSGAHRTFLTVMAAVALIVGLLAMHTLSTGTAHAEPHTTVAIADHDQPAQMADAGNATDTGHCPGDCGGPGNMPDHSMLLMICALALLAAVIVVLAPALLGGLGLNPGVRAPLRDAARALPRPRPPSLLVLSISRT